MSSLSHAARYIVPGSQLAAELSRKLRDLGYNFQGTQDVIDHVDQFGTARGSAADLEDVQAVDDLVRRHTAPVEYEDASQWPDAWDADVWNLTPVEPANAPLPSEAFLPPDLEPSLEDRSSWAELNDREERIDRELDRLADEAAALELVTRGLDAFPAPVRDEMRRRSSEAKPIRVRETNAQARARHSKGQPLLDDSDVITCQGGCG